VERTQRVIASAATGEFLEDVVLAELAQSIVIFIDEI